MCKGKSREDKLREMDYGQLEALYGILSYSYYDERRAKLEIQRELQRRAQDGKAEN